MNHVLNMRNGLQPTSGTLVQWQKASCQVPLIPHRDLDLVLWLILVQHEGLVELGLGARLACEWICKVPGGPQVCRVALPATRRSSGKKTPSTDNLTP